MSQDIGKNVSPPRLSNLTCSLIGQRGMCVEPGIRVPHHKGWKGVKRSSATVITRQFTSLHCITKLSVAYSNHRRRDGCCCGEAPLRKATRGRCIIQVLRECLVTRLSFSLRPVRGQRDSLDSFFTHRCRRVANEGLPSNRLQRLVWTPSATDYSVWSD